MPAFFLTTRSSITIQIVLEKFQKDFRPCIHQMHRVMEQIMAVGLPRSKKSLKALCSLKYISSALSRMVVAIVDLAPESNSLMLGQLGEFGGYTTSFIPHEPIN